MNHNLRSRALIFSLFYHPILAVKAILSAAFRKGARSVLIQAEYDRWFFGGCTLDELPSVSPLSTADDRAVLTGPKLILNATSLNTGERRGFSRDANTRLADLKTSNKNVLKLSQVVGASSGVPVLFPPTPVLEDLLVDGGVGDNQGIEGLRECGCNPLIISDASGQLELAHRQGTGEAEVFMRTNEILQHQVRNKLLDALSAEYELRKSGTDALEFAFFHLYLNLKDDPKIVHRMSGEYIQPIARIRTDLDQFSLIERECLLYHGYTLADAMVTTWCPSLVGGGRRPPVLVPPLFREDVQHDSASRTSIRKELEAGHEKAFVLRSLKKHPAATSFVLSTYAIALLAVLPFALTLFSPVQGLISRWLQRGLLGEMTNSIVRLASVAVSWIEVVAARFTCVPCFPPVTRCRHCGNYRKRMWQRGSRMSRRLPPSRCSCF